MRFFVDNNLPPAIAEALDALSRHEGSEVTHLRREFPGNTADIQWIEALGRDGGWVVVTGDRAIKKNPHERQALIDSGLTVLFLGKAWAHMTFWDKAQKLVRCWPAILSTTSSVVAGAAFEVKANGKLEAIPLK